MSNQLHRYRIVLDYIEPWLDEQDEATLKQIYADLLVLEKEGPALVVHWLTVSRARSFII